MKDELLKLGFTPRQVDVYLALISLGETSIGPLERQLRLHRQLIYNALDELAAENLIKIIPKENKRLFSPSDPENILQNLRAKEALAREVIPQIVKQRAVIRHAHEVEFFEGIIEVQNFFRLALNRQPKSSTTYILGGGGSRFLSIAAKEDFFRRYENIRRRRHIKHQVLLYENQKEDPNIDLYTSRRSLMTYRFLPDNFDQPLATMIWSDRISLLIFEETPLLISLKGKKLVDAYQSYFDILWKTAKV